MTETPTYADLETFGVEHLPPHLRLVALPFAGLARRTAAQIPSVTSEACRLQVQRALAALWEAKNHAVMAHVLAYANDSERDHRTLQSLKEESDG